MSVVYKTHRQWYFVRAAWMKLDRGKWWAKQGESRNAYSILEDGGDWFETHFPFGERKGEEGRSSRDREKSYKGKEREGHGICYIVSQLALGIHFCCPLVCTCGKKAKLQKWHFLALLKLGLWEWLSFLWQCQLLHMTPEQSQRTLHSPGPQLWFHGLLLQPWGIPEEF